MSRGKIVDTPPIPIKSELYEELVKEADEKFYSISDHVERILDRYLKRNKMIGNMWPGLQIASVDEDTIVVVNVSENKPYNVKLRENFLYCEHDRSTGCIHTAFVWMQAEDLELDRKF